MNLNEKEKPLATIQDIEFELFLRKRDKLFLEDNLRLTEANDTLLLKYLKDYHKMILDLKYNNVDG